ncbi:MAG TPA: enoyl-CoA hydratase/isomerase family protein [Micrococcaceae bacterium]|nr:enoyl-CoA hydratase/isomerase family protein [Micrococcaceae bacterium]
MTAGPAVASRQELETVAVEVADAVATISFGTGQRFNALGCPDWRALDRAVGSLDGFGPLRAVVLRGRGGVFCSGSDLREWGDGISGEEVSRSFELMEAALQAIEDLPVPTVAIVEGYATGAGCQLALACDLQLTGASARIGMPIGRLGLLIPATFANRMSLRIGPSRTKDLLYGGRLLSAQEAVGMGLISSKVADDGVDAALAGLLAGWAGLSAASLRASKAAVDQGLQPVIQAGRSVPQGPAADPHEFAARVDRFLHRHRK